MRIRDFQETNTKPQISVYSELQDSELGGFTILSNYMINSYIPNKILESVWIEKKNVLPMLTLVMLLINQTYAINISQV